MAKIDEFKNFVKENPSLITYVRNNEMTWQKFYEIYDLYGTDDKVWSPYLKKDSEVRSTVANSSELIKNNGTIFNLIEMAKKVDPNKLQDGISSIQKAIGLFGDILVKDKTDTPTSSYTPRPIYRKFDD